MLPVRHPAQAGLLGLGPVCVVGVHPRAEWKLKSGTLALCLPTWGLGVTLSQQRRGRFSSFVYLEESFSNWSQRLGGLGQGVVSLCIKVWYGHLVAMD